MQRARGSRVMLGSPRSAAFAGPPWNSQNLPWKAAHRWIDGSAWLSVELHGQVVCTWASCALRVPLGCLPSQPQHRRGILPSSEGCKGPLLFRIAAKIEIATNHSHNSQPRIGSTVATDVSAPNGHNRFSTKVGRQGVTRLSTHSFFYW